MTLAAAVWVLDQQAKGYKWATGNGKVTKGKEQAFIPLAMYTMAQTGAIAVAGHHQLAGIGMKMQKFGRTSHKLVFPGVGSKFDEPFRIVAKNKWLVRGAKLGGRIMPGLNAAMIGYDIYTTGS